MRGREITGRSAAGSSSFIPTHARVLRGVRGRAPAGAAGARIWPPLFSATVPSSSFSSRDVDLQANHCLTTNMRRRFYGCAFHLNLESYSICRGHFWWNSVLQQDYYGFSEGGGGGCTACSIWFQECVLHLKKFLGHEVSESFKSERNTKDGGNRGTLWCRRARDSSPLTESTLLSQPLHVYGLSASCLWCGCVEADDKYGRSLLASNMYVLTPSRKGVFARPGTHRTWTLCGNSALPAPPR
ncbi:uncharacterized protein [Aegilops tauschii subsp. strangulata]|uniref:uncharacterized protein isoform X1 n=1 Tax=Aegilops tauschii subsp. strangulata TaxID=200361 RepID=UPI001ABCA588|nr:uncharacterized protein LOC109749123 isoform X1 [Aegilops tauschii subsp. strangulata]XP_044396185.1 uncharacterized protein LOC123120275 isoform X3 [Triticum aestivum]